jgi:hypothetical protein
MTSVLGKIGSAADSGTPLGKQAMIWLFLGGLGGLAMVGVAAWARGERRKVEAEAAQRRESARLKAEEAQLLAKLRDKGGS